MRVKNAAKAVLKVLRAVITAVIALVLAANLYVLAAKNIFHKDNATVFGFTANVVLTGSMSGTVEPDDLIVTRRCDSYAIGDIVTYSTGATPVTHRIIAEDGDTFTTKGDANNTADEPIAKSAVIGKVVLTVPKVGAAVRFMRSPVGILILLALIVAAVEVPNLINRSKREKSESKD